MLMTTVVTAETLTLHLNGQWDFVHLPNIEQAFTALDAPHIRHVVVDTTQWRGGCLAAAWLLHNYLTQLTRQGISCEFHPTEPAHLAFLKDLTPQAAATTVTPTSKALSTRLVQRVGMFAVQLGHDAYDGCSHFGRVVMSQVTGLVHPKRLRPNTLIRHIYETGIEAVPIVALIAFLISVVIAYLGAQQLRDFGATIYAVDLIAIGVLRELGVLLTAIIVAGRSGSAFAAEIGVMQLNDEVDALRSMGLDPVEVLILPRILGLIITLPLLTIVADAMGLMGGAVLSAWLFDISLPQFIVRVHEVLAPTTFWAGLIKAPVFGFLIAIIGTYRGMQVRNSSRELGRLTTDAVVQSIFMVILANAIFAIVYVQLDF